MAGIRRYESPESSPAIQALLDQAFSAGFDHEQVWEILWLISAHRDLLGLAVAAERIRAILQSVQARNDVAWKEALDDSGIASWLEFLSWVVEKSAALAKKIEDIDRRTNTTGHNPVRGSGSTEFSFYAVLCEPLWMGREDNERFLLLSAHLLLAHVITMREHSMLDDYRRWGSEKDWKFLPNEVAPAARAVRRHTEKDRHRFLADLPVELPPEEFIEELQNLPDPDDETMLTDRRHLARFLRKAWGLADWRENWSGGGVGGGKRWVGGGYENLGVVAWRQSMGDADDPYADWGDGDWLMSKRESSRRRNALLDSDLDPAEEGAEEEILLSVDNCADARPDPGALARVACAKARHVAKRNQLLPWDYALLSDEEFTRLNSALQEEAEALSQWRKWTQAQRQQAEVLVALLGMLLTASSIERIHDVQIDGAGRRDAEDAALRLVFPENGGSPYWKIRAHAPEYAQEWDESAPALRWRVRYVSLPFPGGQVAGLCHRLMTDRPKRNASRLFEMPLASLREAADDWLKARFPDRRVTLAKIESFLWFRMAHLTGDPAHAACLFGSQGTLADVRLFYTTLGSYRLQICYKELLKRQKYQSHDLRLPLEEGAAVGARLCPNAKAVRAAVDHLYDDIMESMNWRTGSGFIGHHNLLTLYVLLFFAHATAIRAIVTPYVEVERIDTERGLVIIDDKDDERKFKTRLAWIPEHLIEQMQVYEDHLSWVRARLPEWDAAPAQQSCFFLDEAFRPIEARPREIEKRLAAYLPVKANTHRRFLRSELLERGCPAEIVDALLGHWQVGEEPFGPYSSLSIEAYLAGLRRYLVPLLEEIGFMRVIPARLAK